MKLNKKLNKKLITLSTAVAIALSGCGGGEFSDTDPQAGLVTGILADGAIGNAEYKCASTVGYTNVKGEFTCPAGSSVNFYYGNFHIGGVTKLPTDKIVLIQDGLDVPRANTQNADVVKLAIFLQSLDNNGDHGDGIFLDPNFKPNVPVGTTIKQLDNAQVSAIIKKAGKVEVPQSKAIAELQKTTDFVKEKRGVDGKTTPPAPTPTPPDPDPDPTPVTPTSATLTLVTSTPITTYDATFDIELSGVAGASIYVGGVDTNFDINSSGGYLYTLSPLSVGSNSYSFSQKEASKNISLALSVEVERTTLPCELQIVNVYRQNLLDADYSLVSKENNITLGITTNVRVEFNNTIATDGLSITSSSSTLGTPTVSDTNLTFSLKALRNANASASGLDANKTLNIITQTHGYCTLTPQVSLFYAEPISETNLDTLRDDYITAFTAGSTSATTISLTKELITANTSIIANMYQLFYKKTSFNVDIGNWDVSGVTFMRQMFKGATSFNQDLNSWNTSGVTSMESMFYGATDFNGNISSWDVSKVTTFWYMFTDATSFNQNIGDWTINTTDSVKFDTMFKNATAFDQNIGGWNTTEVTTMGGMFQGATSFNQDISSWNTAKVTNMFYMFDGATSFNKALPTVDDKWNVSSVSSMNYMFNGATAFDQDLHTWNPDITTAAKPTGFATGVTGMVEPTWK